jgi:hypothetical protein
MHGDFKKAVPNGTNIRFVCWYILENPGATGPQIRKALCDFRGIPNDPKIRRGYYTSYVHQDWRYPQWRRDWKTGTFSLTPVALQWL